MRAERVVAPIAVYAALVDVSCMLERIASSDVVTEEGLALLKGPDRDGEKLQ